MTGVRDAVGEQGFVVVRDVLAPAEVDRVTAALDEVFASEEDIATDRGWATDVHRVAYALPAKHPDLLAACFHPGLLAVAREVLGDDCVVAGCNGLDLPSDGAPQRLHRDHPVPTPGTTLYLHVVCALDPFRERTGATVVVPRSHLVPDGLPVDGAVPVEISRGSVVAFDGSLVHAAGVNRTPGRRRALHLFFARPWVQPHWDFPATLPSSLALELTDEQRRILGYDDRPRRFDLSTRRVARGAT